MCEENRLLLQNEFKLNMEFVYMYVMEINVESFQFYRQTEMQEHVYAATGNIEILGHFKDNIFKNTISCGLAQYSNIRKFGSSCKNCRLMFHL